MLVTKSSNSVKARYLDREAVLTKISEIAQKIKYDNPSVEKVLLFGSIAKNEHTGRSDIDILIITRDAGNDSIKRPLKYYHYFNEIPIPVELIVYHPSEIEALIKEKNSFIIDIINHGLEV